MVPYLHCHWGVQQEQEPVAPMLAGEQLRALCCCFPWTLWEACEHSTMFRCMRDITLQLCSVLHYINIAALILSSWLFCVKCMNTQNRDRNPGCLSSRGMLWPTTHTRIILMHICYPCKYWNVSWWVGWLKIETGQLYADATGIC